MSWETLDTKSLQERREAQHEVTTSGNAGSYTVPLGRPLRPSPSPPRRELDVVDAETRRLMRELYGYDI